MLIWCVFCGILQTQSNVSFYCMFFDFIYNEHDKFTRIFYVHVFIPVNLNRDHWVLARIDFYKNKVWIYDSLLTFQDDKKYKFQFKPFEVIFPRWLKYIGFYNIRREGCATTRARYWRLRCFFVDVYDVFNVQA